MSKDLQNAVNNFAIGFSLGDKIAARKDAAEAARLKWQTIASWHAADAAEKAKRNATYDEMAKKHGALYDAQAEWMKRRGAGGGSGGATGKPAYSPEGQAFIDKQVAAGYNPPAAAPSPQTINITTPEPMPNIPSLPPPPSSGGGYDATSALINEAHGGMVPSPDSMALRTQGVGGTTGPGSGFGVRAAPPSYQVGGRVAAERYRQFADWLRRRMQSATPPAPAPSPNVGKSGAAGATEPDVPPQEYEPRLASGAAAATEPDVPPQPYPGRAGGGGGGRGGAAIDTGEWKGLRDPTRTKAFDYNKDMLDPFNIHYTTATGEVAPWAQRDWAARWNNQNIFGTPTPAPGAVPPGQGTQYRRGGTVRGYDDGGYVDSGATATVYDREGRPVTVRLPPGEAQPYYPPGRRPSILPGREGDYPDPENAPPLPPYQWPGEQFRGNSDADLAGLTPDPREQNRAAGRQETAPRRGVAGVNEPEAGRYPGVPTSWEGDENYGGPHGEYRTGPMSAGETAPSAGPDRAGAGSVRSADEDIHPPSGRGIVPTESRPPVRSGAVDTSRWKGEPSAGQIEADRLTEEWNRKNQAGQQGAPTPSAPAGGAPVGRGGGTEPMGGFGLNPQGSQAGMSTNNVANDMTHIMQAASDFAGHTFHLTQNDAHSAGGYHALMVGHGAAPINMIDQGFKKIDPNGTMPINQKIEMLAQQTYDYWVSQNQPEKASKVAFEIGQFGNKMAQQHARQAGDLLQRGDVQGAATHLVGGYNWLVDGHTAVYDPQRHLMILQDARTGQPTGQIPLTPKDMENLIAGMASGEFNWDVMRGRGQAGAQGPPPGGASRPAVQPAAAPAGPPQQAPAAPPLPPQGEGGMPNSPAGDDIQLAQAQGVQTTTPPQITPRRNTVITSTPPPPGPSSPTNRTAQPSIPEPKEGSDEWYAKNPFKTPNVPDIRRESKSMGPEPDWQALKDSYAQQHKAELDRVMTDAKGLKQSDKPLVPQIIAQVNDRYTKALADLEARHKERDRQAEVLDREEGQRVRKRQLQTQSGEANVESKFEDILVKQRTAYDAANNKMKPEERAKQIQSGAAPNAAEAQQWVATHRSPLRYMATPEDRARLKEIAAKIWIQNPDFSEREALEHAMNFTSFVPEKGHGHNMNAGEKGTNFRIIGPNPFGGVALQNEAGEQIHVDRNTLVQIDNQRRANAAEFKQETKDRAKTRRREQMSGGMLERTGRELRKLPPVDLITTGARAIGELMRER